LNLSLIAVITEDEIIGYQILEPPVLAQDVGNSFYHYFKTKIT